MARLLRSLPTMKTVLKMTRAFVMLVLMISRVEAKGRELFSAENCTEFNLPGWIDWRTDEAKYDAEPRARLTKSPLRGRCKIKR